MEKKKKKKPTKTELLSLPKSKHVSLRKIKLRYSVLFSHPNSSELFLVVRFHRKISIFIQI